MKLSKKIRKLLAFVLTLGIIGATTAGAKVTKKTIFLPVDDWVSNKEAKVSNLQYALVRCYSVYPGVGGKDNYEKIKADVKYNGNRITAITVLSERNTINTKLTFNQYVTKGKTINIRFKGNDPNKSACADVMYTPN